MRARPLTVAACVAATVVPTLAAADSFEPVRLAITVAATGHVRSQLPVSVTVSADAGVLDARTAPLRMLVKLAPECGGTFQYTTGPVLLDKRLNPQPATGRAYTATVKGAGKPTATGVQTVCVWLAEEGDGRVFATDDSLTVDVLKALKPTHRKRKGTHHR